MTTLSLIVKATRLCNLRCKYCFDWRAGPNQVMPFDVLVKTIAAATANPRTTTITFNWHGGEPTMLPVEFYERALYLQQQFKRPTQRVINTVQSNATLLDEHWVSFFAQHAFAVGVSIDGPPDVHDAVRVDRAGRGTFDRVRAGIALLREYQLSFAVIMVVDQPTVARGADALLDFLVDSRITDVALNFVMPPPDSDGAPVDLRYVDPASMAAFLITLSDARRARGLDEIRVRELDALEASLAGNKPHPCTFAGACLGLVFRVEPNGDVYHCDYFGTDPSYRWGNISCGNFDQLRTAPTLVAARRRESAEREALRNCPHYALCRGWCPHQRQTAQKYAGAYDRRCCGLAELVDHLAKRSVAALPPRYRDPALAGLLELA